MCEEFYKSIRWYKQMGECLSSHLNGCHFSLKYHSEGRKTSGSFSYNSALSVDNKACTGVLACLATICKDIDLRKREVFGGVKAVK